MTESRGFSYAYILAAAFLLWVPVAIFGGQGYSALLTLAALPAIGFAPLLKTNRLVVALLVLAVWAGISSLWSDESFKVLSGQLSKGTFSINAAGLRLLLTVIAGILVLGAMMRVRPRPTRAFHIVITVLIVHALVTLVMGVFPDMTLSLYAPYSDPVTDAPQNILRATNAYLLGMPVLLGAAMLLPGRWHFVISAGLVCVSALAFLLVGSDVAVFGTLLLLVCLLVIHFARQTGFRILLGGLAVFIALSPVILSTAGPALARSDLPISASAKSRIWAWQLATDKVAERPVFGHGIEASKEWRETFSDRPALLELMRETTNRPDVAWERYRILPGHPHNMGLQLWAETGGIGVALGIAVLLLLAWRLPPPGSLHPATAVATAGLIAAGSALFNLSYSLWNEAFWASLALAAAAVILLDKAVRHA